MDETGSERAARTARRMGLPAAVLLLAFASAAVAQTASAPASGRTSAYSRLDPRKLSDALRAMQMTELLQELGAAQPPPEPSPTTLPGRDEGTSLSVAEEKARLAEQASDPARRDQLQKEAMDLYRAIGLEAPRSEDDRWNRVYEARLRYLDLCRARVEPLAIRLLYLQGAEEDRRAIVAQTEEPAKALRQLRADLENVFRDYREPNRVKDLVVYQRPGLLVKERAAGIGAYLGLYRGMALPADSSERKTLLNEVIGMLLPYAEGEEEVEGKHRANLLIGIALRELGQHDQAAGRLAAAAAEKAPDEVRLQALFEALHNRIEQKQYDAVPGEVEAFRRSAAGILGGTPDAQLRADVQATLLLDDLYEQQASGEADANRARALRSRGQKALLDFLQKYPAAEVAEPFLDVIGWKYRDRQDRAGLSAIVLVALARLERSRGTEASDQSALQLLERASEANDLVSAAAAPYVLRESAALLFRMDRPREAGRRFLRLAGLPGEPNQAYQAALNAAISFYNAYDAASRAKTLSADLQDELLAALDALTLQWADRPDTGPWFFVLGKVCAEKAQSFGEHTPERAKMLRRSIEALERTPGNLPESPDARFRALEVRLRLLREDPKAADARAQAQALLARMKAFAQDARAALAGAKDKDQIDRWTDYGSRADVGALQVRYEFLQEQDAALRDLPAVLQSWKGAPVTMEALAWEIRALVQSPGPDKIARASARMKAFREQYPAQADGLTRQVVEGIQDRIRAIRLEAGAQAELEVLRQNYVGFASDLYRDAAKADANQAYAGRQMLADALWLAGDGEKSLALWKECAAEDDARTEAHARLVDAEIERRTKDLSIARQSEQALERAVEELAQFLADRKLPPEGARLRAVQEAVKAVKEAQDPDERHRRMGVLAARVAEAYKAAGALWKKQSQVDAMNVLGLARAHRLLKQYGDAMRCYNQLAKGIDRLSFGDFYWDVQLELCQTAMDAYRADKGQMRRLVQYIQQLRAEDGSMGGKAGVFNQIEFDAKRAAE